MASTVVISAAYAVITQLPSGWGTISDLLARIAVISSRLSFCCTVRPHPESTTAPYRKALLRTDGNIIKFSRNEWTLVVQ